MNIVYLHGRLSSPNSSKRKELQKAGHHVFAPALPKDDWDKSLSIAAEMISRVQPDVIVASSRGGAVALNIDTGTVPLVLIAPAWRKFGASTRPEPKGSTTILHSVNDDVVPVADSVHLSNSLPGTKFIEVGACHRMNDAPAISAMLGALPVQS